MRAGAPRRLLVAGRRLADRAAGRVADARSAEQRRAAALRRAAGLRAAVPARCAQPAGRRASLALGHAAKFRDFWILFGSFFVCGFSANGLIGTHLIPACLDHGIPEVMAAGLLAAMGCFDLVGTTLSGWLTDRWDSRYLLFTYYVLRGLSLLYLPFALDNMLGDRPLAVRRVLRARLDRHRAADREADPQDGRATACRHRVRLAVRRPPARRGNGLDRRRAAAHRARRLCRELRHRRAGLRRCRARRAADRARPHRGSTPTAHSSTA